MCVHTHTVCGVLLTVRGTASCCSLAGGIREDFPEEVMAKLPVKREKGTGCGFCAAIELGLSDNQWLTMHCSWGWV